MNSFPDPHQPGPDLPGGRKLPPELLQAASLCREDPSLRLLLEATGQAALVLDEADRAVAFSRAALELLGLETSDPALGLSPGEALNCLWAAQEGGGCSRTPGCPSCGIALVIQACRRLDATATEESLFSLAHPAAGTTGEFRFRATPIRVGERSFVFLALQDTSDARRREALEQFLFRQVLNLADGLEGTVRILSANPESAPLLVQQLSDFTEQLVQEVQGQRIQLQAENGSLQVETRELELSEIMESLGAFFRNSDAAHRRRFELRPYQAEPFRTDPTLLVKILLDLIERAFRSTPVGGTVRVEHLRTADRRRFVVHQEGMVPAETAAGIFQRSFDALASHGLNPFGLRLLAERYLGGRLLFETEEREGARFILELPAQGRMTNSPQPQPPAVAAKPEAPEEGAEKLGTVLIVDDAKVTRHLVQSILSKDFNLLLAETGQEALALATEHLPDLIVLDAVMPGMDGYTVCRHLKADARTRHIPIIFLTALTGKADETQALASGAIDFITKPINPDVVYARVRNHVEMKLAQDRLEDLSLQDSLTGIPNRRAFDRVLEQEWRRGIRSRNPLSLIMGDVDFFKLYNDSLGHQQGDACLCRVAQVFATAVRRPSDLAARYGGEEFACILGDTDAEGAALIAEKIRAGVEALNLFHPDPGLGHRVTVSLGVATTAPDQRAGMVSLVESADQRLYAAKREGRNRVSGPA